MRQGHHGEQLLEAKGKLLFSLLLFFSRDRPARGVLPRQRGTARVSSGPPARGSPLAPERGEAAVSCGAQSVHPAQAPLLPPLRTCCFADGSSVRPLSHLSPRSPWPGPGSTSAAGGCCSSSRPGLPRGSQEAGGGSCCSGSEGPSADHLPLPEPDRRASARPRLSAERRCYELSPQKPGVGALTPSLASKPRRGWGRGGSETGPDPDRDPDSDGPVHSRPEQGVRGSVMRWEQKRRSLCRPWETPVSSPAGAGGCPTPRGWMGCVTGKGPRFAPLNLAAG